MGIDREQAMRRKAEGLITGGDVELIVGYGTTYLGDGVRPLFVRSAPDARKLVWNNRCVHNLTTYLLREPCLSIIRRGGRVGIVSKGCDARSIATLIQEKQLSRDSIHIIGMVCGGVVDEASGEAGVSSRCRSCEWQVPPVYDGLIGEVSEVEPIEGDPHEQIEALRRMSKDKRWAFWTEHLSRCIKCYACRQACPLCYCGECITEKSRPQWIDKASSLKGNIAYHFIRAMHLAGRCISCGECSRACPMEIPVDLLTRFLSARVEEAFDYKPGTDPEEKPFFVTFRDNDPEGFIR